MATPAAPPDRRQRAFLTLSAPAGAAVLAASLMTSLWVAWLRTLTWVADLTVVQPPTSPAHLVGQHPIVAFAGPVLSTSAIGWALLHRSHIGGSCRHRQATVKLSLFLASAGTIALTVVSAILAQQTGSVPVGSALSVGAMTAAGVWVGLTRWLRRRANRPVWGHTRPHAGQVWWADVPFEDGPGSKDRPVLVVAVDDHSAKVLKITSQDKSRRADHQPLPVNAWDPSHPAGQVSWVDVSHTRSLEPPAFRRFAGTCRSEVYAHLLTYVRR